MLKKVQGGGRVYCSCSLEEHSCKAVSDVPEALADTLNRRYVAMHTMQDDNSSNQHYHQDGRMNGYIEGREAPQPQKSSMIDLGAAVFGMILPLFLQFGHAH